MCNQQRSEGRLPLPRLWTRVPRGSSARPSIHLADEEERLTAILLDPEARVGTQCVEDRQRVDSGVDEQFDCLVLAHRMSLAHAGERLQRIRTGCNGEGAEVES